MKILFAIICFIATLALAQDTDVLKFAVPVGTITHYASTTTVELEVKEIQITKDGKSAPQSTVDSLSKALSGQKFEQTVQLEQKVLSEDDAGVLVETLSKGSGINYKMQTRYRPNGQVEFVSADFVGEVNPQIKSAYSNFVESIKNEVDQQPPLFGRPLQKDQIIPYSTTTRINLPLPGAAPLDFDAKGIVQYKGKTPDGLMEFYSSTSGTAQSPSDSKASTMIFSLESMSMVGNYRYQPNGLLEKSNTKSTLLIRLETHLPDGSTANILVQATLVMDENQLP